MVLDTRTLTGFVYLFIFYFIAFIYLSLFVSINLSPFRHRGSRPPCAPRIVCTSTPYSLRHHTGRPLRTTSLFTWQGAAFAFRLTRERPPSSPFRLPLPLLSLLLLFALLPPISPSLPPSSPSSPPPLHLCSQKRMKGGRDVEEGEGRKDEGLQLE